MTVGSHHKYRGFINHFKYVFIYSNKREYRHMKNKKASSPFYHKKIFLTDNKCKALIFHVSLNTLFPQTSPFNIHLMSWIAIWIAISSKASGSDCLPEVVLKNCEPELLYILPELSYILPKLFNKCLNESCFPDCWKVSSMVPVFKNAGGRSTAK